jgi:hypothetical protein
LKIIVSYTARDIYDIPNETWREATASCEDDVDSAFDLLLDNEECDDWRWKSDVTDRYVEVEEG